jgi:hypothetical protein
MNVRHAHGAVALFLAAAGFVSFAAGCDKDTPRSPPSAYPSSVPSAIDAIDAGASSAHTPGPNDVTDAGPDSQAYAVGNMFGDNIGDDNDAGGLGLSGLGEPDGGRGEGIGLGDFGGLGHERQPGDAGTSFAQVREGGTSVNGRLPLAIIQKIVHQHFGQIRLCYVNGLRKDPTLAGRVGVRFLIDRGGAVSFVADGGSDLPDPAVISCVLSGFRTLSFPAPAQGTVSVSFQLVFSPGS